MGTAVSFWQSKLQHDPNQSQPSPPPCAPLFASATSSGERRGTKKFGPNPDIVCDEGLSCQQWQGLKGPGAHYCFGACIEEGGETSKGGKRFGVCCDGLERVKRKCVLSSRVQL